MRWLIRSDTGRTIAGIVISIGLGLAIVLPVILVDILSRIVKGGL